MLQIMNDLQLGLLYLRAPGTRDLTTSTNTYEFPKAEIHEAAVNENVVNGKGRRIPLQAQG